MLFITPPRSIRGLSRCSAGKRFFATRTPPPPSSSSSSSLSLETDQSSNTPQGPLAGIKVLDLTRVLAGPFCTQLLADYGADVVKIEQPNTGDETRSWRSTAEAARWSSPTMSLYFSAVNRSKRSVTLNLKRPEAREVLYALAKTVDIVVENFVPGKAEELGIGYEQLSAANPGLIYASLSGYGSSGPFAQRAGYDAIAAAEGGLMHVTGHPGGAPMRAGLGMTDMATGLLTHGAILAALHERQASGHGRGQRISTSLFETQLSLLINVGLNFLNLGVEGQRFGAAHPSIVPYNTYLTKDERWLALGANNDRQFRTLCACLDRLDLVEDGSPYTANAARVAAREHLDAIVADAVASRTMADWLAALDGSGLAHGPVNSIREALGHPQAKARDMVQAVDCEVFSGHEGFTGHDGPASASSDVDESPGGTDSDGPAVSESVKRRGQVKLIGPAVKFGRTHARIRRRAPLLGEHTEQVLREIRYSDAAIADLRSVGAI